MKALAAALDHLKSGNLACLGDTLVQRMKAVETAAFVSDDAKPTTEAAKELFRNAPEDDAGPL